MPPFKEWPEERPDWALTGAKGREPRTITSLYLGADNLEVLNLRLQNKLAEIAANEVRYETMMTDDAEYLIVAFGTVGRIAQSAVRQARAAGVKAGLFRPVTLWPFPEKELEAAVEHSARRVGGGDERRADGGGCSEHRPRSGSSAVFRAHGRRYPPAR